MPFQITPVKGGFKVKKEGTKKTFSKNPLTKEKATKQLKALYLHVKK